jgi:hypothetical protein
MEFFLKVFIYSLIGNLVFYLLGTFISFDFNPMDWWLFNFSIGRLIILIIEFIIITASIQGASDDF